MKATASLLPEVVSGPRLLLRRWLADDAAAMSAATERNLEHLRPWMSWVAAEPLAPAERVAFIETWEQAWRDGGDVGLGAFLDGRVVGAGGLHRRVGPGGLEIGYWVDKNHLRQGVATEIAGLLTGAALAVDAVTFVEIHHDEANIASAGVPRRLGYAFVGEAAKERTAPGQTGIEWVWRMEIGDWPDQGAPAAG